jgi:uncharacterized integral membrane protein
LRRTHTPPIADNRPLMSALLFIGPAVAVIGIVAVVFVMRHKSVEKRSMYSARRSQIEHKVRAARQRTLAPGRRGEKDHATPEEATIPPAPILTYEPSAFAGPPVAPPPKKTHGAQPVWDAGGTAAAAPSTPTFTAPVQPPPAYEPAPFEAPAAEPVWTPKAEPPPQPAAPAHTAAAAQTSSADAGAAWSVVGETKTTAAPEPSKKKRSKQDAISQATGAWQLASGEAAGAEEEEEGAKKPSAVVAIAQYAVLVVGLVMVLIGVVVMVANSKVT